MDFQTLHKQRKAIIVTAGIGVIAMFLPWVSFLGIVSVNGLHGGGIIVLLAFIGAGLLAFLNGGAAPLDKTRWAAVMACGAVAAAFMVYALLSATEAIGFLGIGFWLALLASVAVLGAAWMFRDPSHTIRGGFDTLKDEVNRRAGNVSNTHTPPPPPASRPTNSSTMEDPYKTTSIPPASDEERFNPPPTV